MWSAPYFDEGAGNVWMISYSVPFYRKLDGVFNGVAFTDLRIDTLQADLGNSGHFSGQFAVLDAEGNFLFHNQQALAGKSSQGWAKDARLSYLMGPSVALDGRGYRVANWPGLGRAWVYKERVPGSNWELLSAVPDRSLLAGMGARELFTAVALLAGVGLAVLAALAFTRRYTQPLVALTVAVNATARGEWNTPIAYRGTDELGELADAFRLMRMHIADRDRRLRDANQQLEGRVAERTLAAQAVEQRLRAITNSIPCTVFQLLRGADGSYHYSFISEGAERQFGVPPGVLLADFGAALALIHPQDAPYLLSQIEASARDGRDFEAEYQVVNARSGLTQWTHTSATFVGEIDGVRRWNGYHIDISPQKQLETELLSAKQQADEANLAKGRFLASMSHELRTPMNAVIGLADLTLQTPLNRQQHDWVAKIHRAATSQLRLVNDVLDFSKLEAGKMQIESLNFELLRVLDSAFEMVADTAQQKGLKLLQTVQPGLPSLLVGDALRLTQVLLNLLSNAIKFTERGSVVVRVESLGRSADAIQLRFAVSDTGIGVPAESRHKLFKAFSQADASTTRRYGGTGLGLVICSEIVSQMGGSIGLDSSSAQGSRFVFDLSFGLTAAPLLGMAEVLPGEFLEEGAPTPAAPVQAALEAAERQKLLAELARLRERLANADGDAVDHWGALITRYPWLAETLHGQQAHKAFSAYRFPAASTALEQLASTLP